MAARFQRTLVALLAVALVFGLWFGWRAYRRDVHPGPGEPAASGGALVASLRSEPAAYNRLLEATAAADLLALLTHATLVKVDRTTDELQPALAESWTQSPDGLTYTLKLRSGVQFADGAPLTSADVLFTSRVLYDVKVNSVFQSGIRVGGQPLVFEAPDPATVIVRLPAPFAPGLRLLETLPILPRHKLEAAFNAGTFREQWKIGTPLSELTGLGPFVLTEHTAGQRMAFSRNPRYWKRDSNNVQLPYLDKLTVTIVPDQNTEALRMESGAIDLMSNGDIRPDDYAAFKRASEQNKLRLIDVGVSLDPNLLWFNLQKDNAIFREKAFRQAVSYAVDRQAIVNTVFLGTAVPIHGPVTPGNKTWYTEAAPTYAYDAPRARELLASLGLKPRAKDGLLVDAQSRPVRFSLLTQKGHTIRERTATVIQEHLRQVGITVDVVGLDTGGIVQRWQKGDYDSIYFGVQASSTDPSIAMADFWLSSGPFHFWHPRQKAPATEWETRIDELMRKVASAPTLSERQQLFADVQTIFGEQLPAIYFVAPRVTLAVSGRVANPQPALLIPQLLWSADTLRVDQR
jgi:peptide/nickel transport system substrate-binding protein